MTEIGLGHYLSLGAIIFFLGVIGIFLNRKNVIVILMSVELILLAVNINLISFSIFSGDIVGQIFTMLILTVAAAGGLNRSCYNCYLLSKQRVDKSRRYSRDEGVDGVRNYISTFNWIYHRLFGKIYSKIFF